MAQQQAQGQVVCVSRWYLLSILLMVVIIVWVGVVVAWYGPRGPTLPPEEARLMELLRDRTMEAIRQELVDHGDYLGAAFQDLRIGALHDYVCIKQKGLAGLEARPTASELSAATFFQLAGHKEAKEAYEKLLEVKYGKNWREGRGNGSFPKGATP